MKKIEILLLKTMRYELFIPMLSSITWPIVEKNLMTIIQLNSLNKRSENSCLLLFSNIFIVIGR